ncbi:MAG: 50S ribosomal protein L32e [Candidatus Micrarchaeia archaeon]|jgi:large subunit ribosomal protein L32e
MAAKHPKFQRQNVNMFKRLKRAWRKPRGIDNKMARKIKAYGAHPDVGYRQPAKARHVHPCGLREVLVANAEELAKVNPKTQCARIRATVGARKREQITKKARELGVKVLNA